MPFAGLIGIEFLAVDPAEVRARLGWSPDRCTVAGVMHGGALMALADACGAVAAFVNLPEGAVGTTTLTSATNFLAAVRDGHANAASTILHRGRTTIVVETVISDDNGRTVAKITQTQAVLS
ncbi:MAG: PaaI family thioesterase [Microthrixaceae bacterium]